MRIADIPEAISSRIPPLSYKTLTVQCVQSYGGNQRLSMVIEQSSIKIVHAHNARQQVHFFNSVKEMVAGNDPDASPQLC